MTKAAAATHQAGILEPIPVIGHYLSFTLDAKPAQLAEVLKQLAAEADGECLVVGVGLSTVLALGRRIDGLRTFPQLAAPGIDAPATPAALWCWLRGSDCGDLLLRAHAIERMLAPAFELQSSVSSFMHGADTARDLSGYEDGTENPKGDDATDAAIVQTQGAGLDGSSFVTVQQWLHDFDKLQVLRSQGVMDDVIGRHHADNSECEDAPVSSHVHRTEQESFSPEAHVVRRSMPWSDGQRGGLMFVAFGRTLDAFEAQWGRMMGQEDGITDALFGFTRPISGAYYWCPPVRNGQLDVSALTD